MVFSAHQESHAPGIGTIHIILAVTDHGTPRLTSYQRVVVDVKP
jgi:hypothetical protein